jgi:hypothetical protein
MASARVILPPRRDHRPGMGAGVGPGAARLPRELGVGRAGIFWHNFAAFDRDQATERAAWVT